MARKRLRFAFQAVVGLAAAMPLLIAAAGVPESVPEVGVLLAVAAGITRVVALPIVDRILPRWLRAEDPDADLRKALGGRE